MLYSVLYTIEEVHTSSLDVSSSWLNIVIFHTLGLVPKSSFSEGKTFFHFQLKSVRQLQCLTVPDNSYDKIWCTVLQISHAWSRSSLNWTDVNFSLYQKIYSVCYVWKHLNGFLPEDRINTTSLYPSTQSNTLTEVV